MARPIIASVVSQHVEEAAHLRLVRSVLVRAPHVGLLQLGRIDERIAAHLDGVRVAGEGGTGLARAALDRVDVGSAFTVLVGAVEQRDMATISKVLSLRDAVPDVARAAASAVGWVSAADLRGLIKPWLDATDASLQWLALAACGLHRADPGAVLASLVGHADARVRLRALQAAGELGRVDLRDACVDTAAAPQTPPHDALLAARAALLLGDRAAAIARTHTMALAPSPHQALAAWLTMLFGDADRARALVSALAKEAAVPSQRRLLIQASGWSGDPKVVPWLLQQMEDLKVSRLAGEAFSSITGADLAKQDLERMDTDELRKLAPSGPTDDPEDDDVALDDDESLPWPKVDAVRAWWSRESSRFTLGERHLLGGRMAPVHLLHVLDVGTQRVRAQAAVLRCVQAVGTPPFNVAAPQRRQLRALQALRST